MRVLAVDDSEGLVQGLLSSLAEVTGLKIVGPTGNAADAALEIRKAKPDVIILETSGNVRKPETVKNELDRISVAALQRRAKF
jgi:DNA-binding NarL/FixJ family response regulator